MTALTQRIVEGPLQTPRLTVHALAIRNPGAPKVLLLGGSNFDLRLKRAFLSTSIAQETALVTYEPRGIGRTEQPDGPWTMQDYARDALSVLDAMGWASAVVVGESFGGMTALQLAILAPKRVQRLVISSATTGGPEHASYDISEFLKLPVDEAARLALCLQDTRNGDLRDKDPKAFAEVLAGRIEFETAFRTPSVTSGGYERLLAARRGHDCRDKLHLISQPTTVIAGRFDVQARPESQQVLAASMRKADFHQFDAGHGVLFSHPDAVRIALDAIRLETSLKETTQ